MTTSQSNTKSPFFSSVTDDSSLIMSQLWFLLSRMAYRRAHSHWNNTANCSKQEGPVSYTFIGSPLSRQKTDAGATVRPPSCRSSTRHVLACPGCRHEAALKIQRATRVGVSIFYRVLEATIMAGLDSGLAPMNIRCFCKSGLNLWQTSIRQLAISD